ncbi:ABC transporter ATP-binding protein [Schleiferilactobacillus shenzhenensis]|uniref:BceA n=1 Tax=Schleiferilactobacillus shenzhenensis LY-73 TaxID=1231336 RepID=U4TWD2_9LACO|nr:ABC transporter ATP-binding protein [Schleiferilactobacillus shenzhenensis]ERL66153.1 BceA [Schleiferilactobacillus shenzhenensis LY-73]
MALVTVQGLTKIFGHRLHPVRALNGLTFSVEKGEFVGIMGPSGAGKTTLLSIISTIDVPTNGTVTVAGTEVTHLRGDKLARFRRANLGYVFQDFNLLTGMTVRENILLPLTIGKHAVANAQERLNAVLSVTGLTNLAQRYPEELSIGQQQRVAVARALITEPALVFADEPTGALDSKAATELLRYLTTINQEWHTTIMMATHDAFTASYCSRVIFIKDGMLFAEIRRSGERQAFFDAIIDMQATIGGGGHWHEGTR